MPRNGGTQKYRNKLLRGSGDDIEILEPLLTPVDLPLRTHLEFRNKPIEFAYFVEHGLASVVAGLGGRVSEVGIIGCEGVTALPVVMGTDRSPHDCFMQVAGNGYRISTADLVRAMAQRPDLRVLLTKFAHVFTVQAASTSLANARNKMEERLARWLLMADDRVSGNSLKLTHEFLAIMLGVRRPGVTIAVNVLVRQGLITSERGTIVLIDRAGLKQAANGCYGTAEAEYKRVFGF